MQPSTYMTDCRYSVSSFEVDQCQLISATVLVWGVAVITPSNIRSAALFAGVQQSASSNKSLLQTTNPASRVRDHFVFHKVCACCTFNNKNARRKRQSELYRLDPAPRVETTTRGARFS